MGYIGGSVIAGKTIGRIAETQGWRSAFVLLTIIAAASCVAAGIYWILQAAAAKPGRSKLPDPADGLEAEVADEIV